MSIQQSTDLVPLRAEDREPWLKLWRGYQAFYEVEIAPEATDTTWARMLDANEPMHGLIAWQGGEAVGLVHYLFHRSTWTVGNYCYLQDLFVDPSVRGGGVGRRLIEAVYAAAEAKASPRVYWLTHETNGTAMALYDRVADRSGFVQYRRNFTC